MKPSTVFLLIGFICIIAGAFWFSIGVGLLVVGAILSILAVELAEGGN